MQNLTFCMETSRVPGVIDVAGMIKKRYGEVIAFIPVSVVGVLISMVLLIPQYHRISLFALCSLGVVIVELRNWRCSLYLLAYIPFQAFL